MRFSHSRLAALLIVLLAGGVTPAAGQRPLNLGFEQPSRVVPQMPWGWWLSNRIAPVPEVRAILDSMVRREGRLSLRVDRTGPANTWLALSDLDISRKKMRRVRMRGWIRTESLEGGSASLRMEQRGSDYKLIAADSMVGQGLRGTKGWTLLELQATIDSATTYLIFGVQADGRGTAWFDALSMELDGRPVTETFGPAAISPSQAAWLRARTRQLRGVLPGKDDRDLEAIDSLIGNARLISLGEATHGSREFFQLKHRLIEHLARAAHFSVILLEANQLHAERVNRYVLTGEGNARDVMSGLFRVLKTEEVLAMVEWARAYNASGAGRVEIIGYDMQNPKLAIDSVLAFLRRRDPAFSAAADSAYRDLAAAWSIQGIPPEPDSSVRVWQASTDRVRQHVRGRQAAYLARAQSAADSAEVTWALQNAELIYQSASFGDESPSAVRDSAMAANIAWAMSQRPGARGVIWAHNFHVSRQPGTMGRFLERMLPGEVKIFALTGAQGEYTAASSFSSSYAARQYEAFPIMPASPPAGSVASVLVQGGWPVAVVDLREAPTSPAAAWLREPRPFLSVGGMAMDYSYSLEALPGAYDFLLFVRSTTPSRGLQ